MLTRASFYIGVLACLLTTLWAGSSVIGQEKDRASLVERAKREGRVVWYTTMGLQDASPLANAFQKEYPFIKVLLLRAPGEAIFNKVLIEARAKKNLFDIVGGRGEMVFQLKKKKLIRRYRSLEAASYDDDLKDRDGYWHVPYVVPWFLGYNTDLVKKSGIPKTYDDLLHPKWKDQKISYGVDDGVNLLFGLISAWGKERAVRFFQQLAKQDPILSRGSRRLRVQLLAAGEFSLTLAGGNTFQSFMSKGAPIDWVALEPVFVQMYPIMLGSHAPHSNAGKLFIDFMLSKKGQEMIRSFYRIPARVDVAPDPPRLFKGFRRTVEDIGAYKNFRSIQALHREIFNVK